MTAPAGLGVGLANQVTLGVGCPIHGHRRVPASRVRIARRRLDDGLPEYAITAPCPADDCSVSVLVPPRARAADLVDLLIAGGAQVVDTRGAAARVLVEFPVPDTNPPGGAA